MRRLLLTNLLALAWLLSSPTLQLPEGGWLEVGATPAAAQDTPSAAQDFPNIPSIMAPEPGATKKKKSTKKKSRPARIGSGSVVTSNQPGFYPMQQIQPPQTPDVTGTVTTPAPDPRYPNVRPIPILPRGSTAGAGLETSQDRVVRCTQQGSLAGLSGGRRSAYVQDCAF
jgi:hypothetical protein